ncbi:MAG: PHB depolymerase family esterase [Myxococcales bacterium]
MIRFVLFLTVLLCTSACYLLHARDREAPELSAGIHAETLQVREQGRTYLLYLPKQRRPRAPLLVLLHGSKQTGEDLRRATGYAFDRLADQHGFVAVYPDGFERRWNDCRAAGRNPARKQGIDDVGFLLALTDRLATEADIDPGRVFLAGYSNGAQLAFRMALERPERVAGIATFSANLPTEDNFACQVSGKAVPALLINGTDDRINPFHGGEVTVFGFATRGTVRSAEASAAYFAGLAALPGPELSRLGETRDTWVEQRRWYRPGAPEVVLMAVHGGGHVVPGPAAAFPRILGKVTTVIDGPAEVWNFFARQP